MRHFTCVIHKTGKLKFLLGQPGTESNIWVDLSLGEAQIHSLEVKK